MTRKVKITKTGTGYIQDRPCPECNSTKVKVIDYRWKYQLPDTTFRCFSCSCEWIEDDYERMNRYLNGDEWIEIDDTERR